MSAKYPYNALLLWAGFLLLSLGTYGSWTTKNWFPVTGDEPHYLVMADAIVNDFTFEQTDAYSREFSSRNIYNPGMAPAGELPSPSNTHAVRGPNGLFNVHNVGLPLLLALPYWLAGVAGAKVFLVFLASCIVLLAWRISLFFEGPASTRILAVVAAGFSPTFFIASNQVYPDLVAGLIALTAIYRIMLANSGHEKLGWKALFVACVVAFLPWLQIKFAAAALVLTVGLVLASYCYSGTGIKRAVAVYGSPLLGSLVSLALYNLYAFGSPTGPYSDGALVANSTSLMVFLGLHLDRFQGIFIQNPLLFLALVFCVPFVKTYKIPGLTILATYGALVLPNALHPNWYGGWSFAARFAWAGAVVLVPLVLYGVFRITRLFRFSGQAALCLLIGLNALTYMSFTFARFDLYNKAVPGSPDIWLSSYPSFHRYAKDFLPAFFDSRGAFDYAVNGAFIAFSAGLLLISLSSERATFRRALSIFLGSSALYLGFTGITSHYPEEPLRWHASALPSDIGTVSGNFRVASSGERGFLTYGPYVQLDDGKYSFEASLDIEGSESSSPIGYIDVFVPASGLQLLKLPLHNGMKSPVVGSFELPSDTSGQLVEVRTFFEGNGRLEVQALQLSHIR